METKIKIGDVEYTVDEARKIYQELNKLFGKPTGSDYQTLEKRVVIERPQPDPYKPPYIINWVDGTPAVPLGQIVVTAEN